LRDSLGKEEPSDFFTRSFEAIVNFENSAKQDSMTGAVANSLGNDGSSVANEISHSPPSPNRLTPESPVVFSLLSYNHPDEIGISESGSSSL
jgi:hypothetical protein